MSGCKQVIYRHLAADMFAIEKLYYVPKTRPRSGMRYLCSLYENSCELQSTEYCVAILILLSVLKSVSYVATKINKRDRKRENEQEERREKMRNFSS
jgi:deoxyadenosine/deoxycytidine kinase